MTEIFGVIYKTTNNTNGKTYVGKSTRKGRNLESYFGSGRSLKKEVKNIYIYLFKRII